AENVRPPITAAKPSKTATVRSGPPSSTTAISAQPPNTLWPELLPLPNAEPATATHQVPLAWPACTTLVTSAKAWYDGWLQYDGRGSMRLAVPGTYPPRAGACRYAVRSYAVPEPAQYRPAHTTAPGKRKLAPLTSAPAGAPGGACGSS